MLKKIFIAAAMIAILGTSPVQAKETLVLNTGTLAPYTTKDHKGFLDQLIKEVFKRIGENAEVSVYAASARAMQQANDGVDAGFAMRVKGLEKRFTNMVMIPEKVIDNDFVALSIKHKFSTSDWASLDKYDVAYILGWKIFERNLADHKNVLNPRNADQLIDMLKHDRVDAILYERWQGAWRSKNNNLSATVLEPALASVPMYMYLNKKHGALVAPAAAALKAMKADGSYDKIFKETLTSLSQ